MIKGEIEGLLSHWSALQDGPLEDHFQFHHYDYNGSMFDAQYSTYLENGSDWGSAHEDENRTQKNRKGKGKEKAVKRKKIAVKRQRSIAKRKTSSDSESATSTNTDASDSSEEWEEASDEDGMEHPEGPTDDGTEDGTEADIRAGLLNISEESDDETDHHLSPPPETISSTPAVQGPPVERWPRTVPVWAAHSLQRREEFLKGLVDWPSFQDAVQLLYHKFVSSTMFVYVRESLLT